MCVFSAASPPKKHTLVLFEAAGGGLKKNILFRTRYLDFVKLALLKIQNDKCHGFKKICGA